MTSNFRKTGVGKRFLDIFHFKGDGMELGKVSACLGKLSWIDGKCLFNPIEVCTGDFWRLMDMAMKG